MVMFKNVLVICDLLFKVWFQATVTDVAGTVGEGYTSAELGGEGNASKVKHLGTWLISFFPSGLHTLG